MTTQPIQSEKELREEWDKVSDPRRYETYDDFDKKSPFDPSQYPESQYELDPDKTADWWLDKMKQNQRALLTSLIEEMTEFKIKRTYEVGDGSGNSRAGVYFHEDDVRALLTAKLKALGNE